MNREISRDPEIEAVLTLMRRMVSIGQLLPFRRGDDIGLELAVLDPEERVDVEMILNEMSETKAAVDAKLAAVRARLER
jgi:hypothetical protein